MRERNEHLFGSRSRIQGFYVRTLCCARPEMGHPAPTELASVEPMTDRLTASLTP
jgi:hypothetical protein